VIGVDRATVVGVGLIGGSIARELASRGVHVQGFDENRDDLDAAVQAGAVHEPLDDSLSGVRDSGIIVIAVPVDSAIDVLARVAPRAAKASLITDVGSTKARIVAAAAGLGIGAQFVGSHPIAGDHRSGWAASRLGLFGGACVYLCPSPDTSQAIVERATALWRELGAHPALLSADEHDRRVAWTSHLPHVVANALALALAQAGTRRAELGPGGRDVTRLAGSSPEMWAAILRENADAIDSALAAAEREIEGLRNDIARDDADALRRRFAVARAWFES
jgi:prephenate dehydrogenase